MFVPDASQLLRLSVQTAAVSVSEMLLFFVFKTAGYDPNQSVTLKTVYSLAMPRRSTHHHLSLQTFRLEMTKL